MQTLVPADSLVYLETNDLAAALQPIIDSKPFTEVAKYKPDFSPLKGVQLAVAVTGFETSEEKANDEQSIGRIQPHFVAIADTHAWNFQAVGFAEKKLGSFVEKIYDQSPTLEKSDKNGGKYFTWTAEDGRKAYALVIDAVIYFGNDESAIDKCLAVRRGEADSIIKTGKIQPADPATLASGYVSTDGIAQIANIVGLKFAAEASDESEVQSAIASTLPQLLRTSISEITWTTRKGDQGYEDYWQITMPSDVATVLHDTMTSTGEADTRLLSYVSTSATAVTLYNLKDPHTAWQTIVQLVQQKSGTLSGLVLSEILDAAMDNYDIANGEMFLSSVGPTLVTTRISDEDDRVAVISTTNNSSDLTQSFSSELKQYSAIKPLTGDGLMTWKSDDGTSAACLKGHVVAIGDAELVATCEGSLTDPSEWIRQIPRDATAVTVGRERGNFAEIFSMFTNGENRDKKSTSSHITETRFTKTGLERKTTSDFGLIGSIIAQLAEN